MWTWCTSQDVATHPTVQYDFTHGMYLNLQLPHRVSQPASHQSMSVCAKRCAWGHIQDWGRRVPRRWGQHLVPPHMAETLGEPFRDLLVPELAASAAPDLSVPLATYCSVPLPTMFHFPTYPTVLLSQMFSSVWSLHQSFHHPLAQQPCLLQHVILHFSLSLHLLHRP